MTNEEVGHLVDQLADAIKRDDETAGRNVATALAKIIIGDLHRIADALDHIARNVPAPK